MRSIDSQTFRDFEVIVSDDSPYRDVELLSKEKFSFNICYHRNIPAKGAPEIWSYAVSLANGDWKKLMHHDDYFNLSTKLQEFVNASASSSQTDYFFSAISIFDSKNGKQFPYVADLNHLRNIYAISALLFHENLIGAPSAGFFKRKMNLNYDKTLTWLVDIECYIRLLGKFKFQFVDKPLITTVISKGQLTTGFKNNKELEISEFLYCYCKHIDDLDQLNKRIMRSRLLNIFNEFEVKNIHELEALRLISPIPLFAKLYLISCFFNKKLANKVFYKLNHH